jgi:hypothetical protein
MSWTIWIIAIGLAFLFFKKIIRRRNRLQTNVIVSAASRPPSATRTRSRTTYPTPRAHVTPIYYRTKDGSFDYGFVFNCLGNSFRVYIVKQPSYGSRDTGAHPTHRLFDNGYPYVCWDGVLKTEADAKNVAKLWAECTQEYIRSGKRF